jgi:dihydropyrimidinase
VEIVSTSVAQAFGIYPQKGVIAAGSDADIIIFDPAAEHTISAASHHSRMDTNIYEGKRIIGKVTVD